MTDEEEARERRIVTAALILVVVVAAAGLGAAFSPEGSTRSLAVPALGLVRLLTVGMLPRRERSVELRPGLVRLGLHHALPSLPMARWSGSPSGSTSRSASASS